MRHGIAGQYTFSQMTSTMEETSSLHHMHSPMVTQSLEYRDLESPSIVCAKQEEHRVVSDKGKETTQSSDSRDTSHARVVLLFIVYISGGRCTSKDWCVFIIIICINFIIHTFVDFFYMDI